VSWLLERSGKKRSWIRVGTWEDRDVLVRLRTLQALSASEHAQRGETGGAARATRYGERICMFDKYSSHERRLEEP